MSKVHVLWFVQESEEYDTELLVGIYETEAAARAAIERLKDKPGFSDFRQGFQIHCREIGQDSWTEGFVRSD